MWRGIGHMLVGELFQSTTEGEPKDETSGRHAFFDSQVILNEVLAK